MTNVLLNPWCPINQEAFLAHHQVEVYWDGEDWGLAWKHGFLGMISRKPERTEAAAIASLFVHWWLSRTTGLDPGELERAAWFFHNPHEVATSKAKFADDADAARMFAFVEQELARYPR